MRLVGGYCLHLEIALDEFGELLGVERFGNIFLGTTLHALEPLFGVMASRQHNDRNILEVGKLA